MKQTAVQQFAIAFREWQRDWDFFEERGKDKPVSFDEFINPYLEMEKQQIIDARVDSPLLNTASKNDYIIEAEQYYNKTYKNK